MHTVPGMHKRFLAITGGVLLGTCMSVGAARLAAWWGWWPDREADRSAAYVREVMELVRDNYVKPDDVPVEKLTHAALHGMMDSLDPHSEFMEKRSYDQLQEEMNSEFGGIGVQVEKNKSHVVVIAPIAGTPSERAGVLRGDEIVSVDGNRLSDATMDDVVDLLRGKPKTTVQVGFFRPSTNKEYQVKLEREIIKVDSVRAPQLLPGGIGYIQLTEFAERTADEFRKALKDLEARHATGLILDLRNNPGGLLEGAVAVAEPFFRKGDLIVYTQGAKPEAREEFRSKAKGEPLDLPMVVLINAGTASAAEIVSGALKDTHKAVIVGERSFGKGSVQSIFRLKNGEGLRLTTARYYTPSGVTIHEHGVEPDVSIVMTPEEDRAIDLQRLREDVKDPKEFKARFGIEPAEDRQLEAAVDVLTAARKLAERKAG